MINLIPPQVKKGIIIEYYSRVGIVFLWLCIIGMSIVALTLLPALVLVMIQGSVIDSSYAQIEADSSAFEAAKKTVEAANQTAIVNDAIYNTQPLLPLLKDIQALAGQRVQLDSIALARDEERNIATVIVSGEAVKREALAAFRDQLRDDARFTNVELPLSNLAKNEEVPFSISLEFVNVSPE